MSVTAANCHLLEDRTYLGDGVYAGNDGYQVWVWASDGSNVTSGPVALEGEVMEALVNYNRRIRGITSRV